MAVEEPCWLGLKQAQKEGNDGQTILPQCRKPQHKKVEPENLDLSPLSSLQEEEDERGPAIQLNQTLSSSKKVTFGLKRSTTAEFKKTDKSTLVSSTGPSRVAFNPEQRSLHRVLKAPISSLTSTILGTRTLLAAPPNRRPMAMDF
ncbi:Ribosomal RNA processing protein 1 like protein B [Fukomys damarensis]|uniref:Ribosomal RNA processing protein 1 like protein B n=1 Tax=Fukomys damarensis TaxID=885580 RepID=A0A091DR60_FUKDA|nr:Ribosomal RNA processing protein 1 like protein B [Fukomys damarensis]